MKKTLLVVLATIFTCSTAFAQTELATVTSVVPNYEIQKTNVPSTRCTEVQVPIYGSVQGQGASGGDVLAGALIGGILGKALTGDDNGAAFGALAGAMTNAESKKQNQQVITGYKTENRCQQVYSVEMQKVLKNYKITYQWNGHYGSSYTYNVYNVGDVIPVTVRIVAK